MASKYFSLSRILSRYKVSYAPLADGATATYFKRMAAIEETFYEQGGWSPMLANFKRRLQHLEANEPQRVD